jgi:hypothetical protein
MNIIQTLWCGDRKLTESPFWWNHAEYNLMSWALSCMSLKEHYSDITLYTDSEGARVLVDTLKLPYSEVIVNFDRFHCLTCHWALAKVRAYSLQTSPFLHIDGDIYLPHKLPQSITGAQLVAQNKEYCTDYYKGMISRFLAVDGLKLAPQFSGALAKDDVPSYNLGFCGGNGLKFFGEFCEEVERFFKDNDFNGERFRSADISANVVYEQIFFSIMARNKGIAVSTVCPDTIRDNGYRADEFCDLAHYDRQQFIHVLGGHKRTQEVCNTLEHTLLSKYPETYERIAALFPSRHKRLYGMAANPPRYNNAAEYMNFLKKAEEQWSTASPRKLLELEREIAGNIAFLNSAPEERQAFVLQRNLYTRICKIADSEHEALRQNLSLDDDCRYVAALPTVSGKGSKEIPLNSMAYNIMNLLDTPTPFAELGNYISMYFSRIPSESIKLCVEKVTEILLKSGLATANKL